MMQRLDDCLPMCNESDDAGRTRAIVIYDAAFHSIVNIIDDLD